MITGTQVRMARAALRWKVKELADQAGVAPNTVTRAELSGGGNRSTLAAMQRALELAGIRFVEEPGWQGVMLKMGEGADEGAS